MRGKRQLLFAAAFVAAAGISLLTAATAATSEDGPVTLEKRETTVYQYDFEEDTAYYLEAPGLTGMDTAVSVSDGKLIPQNKLFLFGTEYRLGDDYGLSGGSAQFDLVLEDGTVDIGLRTIVQSARRSYKGIWISIGSEEISVKLQPGKETASAKHSVEFAQEQTLVIRDSVDEITIRAGAEETLLMQILYSSDRILVKDGAGNPLLEAETGDIPAAGYLRIGGSRDFIGTFDNLQYEHTEIERSLPPREQRIVSYNNWVATDDLGRSVAGNSEAGDPKEDKYVGIFYFISFDQLDGGIYDHTKAYLEGGLSGLWEQLESGPVGYGRYWAEPYFGYYINGDTWVYRKHAYQLTAAGVDFVFLDMSNALTYPEAHIPLFETWLQIRREGGQTPQIVCFTGDRADVFIKDFYTLYENIYKHEKYDELHFLWEGKPLLLGNPFDVDGNLDAQKAIKSNAELLDFYNNEYESVLEQFTIRKSWAWKTDPGYWPWLMDPQSPGTDFEGNVEQISVAIGHHASTSKGRSYVDGVQPDNGKDDFEFSSDTARYGLGFESQFRHAMEMEGNPSVMMITGWNEWTAGKWKAESENQIVGNTPVDFTFVDQFNPEFSRDAEAMKLRDGVGFGDNFYYQMTDYIRRFKGIEEPEQASGQKEISLDGDILQWDGVGPEFRDTIGDTMYRSAQSFGGEYQYINTTGRNDIDYAKVSVWDGNLYFLAAAVDDLVLADDEAWMNLLIDYDGDPETGWEGYDFILNRSREDGFLSVERFVNNSWEFERVGSAPYTVSGRYLTVQVPESLLGGRQNDWFDFKWTDNSTRDGNIMEYMDLGDAAPNDRFNFRFIYEKGFFGKLLDHTAGKILFAAAVVLILGGGIAAAVILVRRKQRTAS